MTPALQTVGRIGFWSGILTFSFAVTYSVAQIASLFGVFAPPWDWVYLFTPSFFLASAFLVLMVAVLAYAGEERKIWGYLAVVFAVLYAAMVSIVYFVELVVVIPLVLQGRGGEVALLLFEPGSFMVAVDALGYAFMSVSTLVAAPVFVGGGLLRWTRLALIANGLLAPVIALAFLYPILLALGILWIVTLPLSALLLTMVFHTAWSRAGRI